MSSDSDSEDGTYCGMNKPTKKKKRATAEYCMDKNQVRHYGVVAVPASLVLKKAEKKMDLVTEQLKYRAMIDKRTIMLKNYRNAKVIAENDNEKPSKRATARKEMTELRKRNVTVRARMAKQYELIIKMEKAQDEARAEEAKRKKDAKRRKSTSKDSKKKKTKAKKSGSKTTKSTGGNYSTKSTKRKSKTSRK